MQRHAVRAAFLAFIAATSLHAQAQPRVTQQAAAAETETAAQAGTTAGGSKSTATTAFGSGSLSFLLPGSGYLYLLFLRSGEVQPNFAEQAFLKDKNADFTKTWVEHYDRALTKKQRKTIIVASTVGTVAAIVMYKALLSSGPSY